MTDSCIHEPASSLPKAVQYLRMSTEHQRYSLENQAVRIAAYALERGYQVIDTYADPGRSGLTLEGRPGLKRLLADAMQPDRLFQTVLVLDVSRWGRFQDPDQAAHYEFICREAGVKVVYCAEPFENDGTAVASILKTLKRVMAGEYSRELSEKVARAQLRQARLGFKQGGTQPYGFRRLLIDDRGNAKAVLQPGQIKALATDKVVFAHGPPDEVEVIRRIFRMWAHQEIPATQICRTLNDAGVLASYGGRWTDARVRSVLRNELCIGNMIYNRTSTKLKARRQINSEADWVRVRCLPPIIDRPLWLRAQRRLASRSNRQIPDRTLLKRLRQTLNKHGYISHRLLRRPDVDVSVTTLKERFGSFERACELIGYRRPHWRWERGPDDAATDRELLEALRRLYAREGRISTFLIAEDRHLPTSKVLAKRFGKLTNAYRLAGLPSTQSAIVRESAAHRQSTKGRRVGPHRSNGQLLDDLRRLRQAHGYVTGKLIMEDPACTSIRVYVTRFGSLLEAYRLAGFPSTLSQIRHDAQRRRVSRIAREGSPIARQGDEISA